MVVEGEILLRVEHFQQRRRRIAAKIHGHLVDFIEQEERVSDLHLAHVLDDLAGHGADIRAPMAADLRLVPHASQGHADEFAVGGACNALANRSLADPGRTDQAKYGTLQLADALLHGEVFQDAFLDLVQSVVVFFQHLLRLFEIARHPGALFPGDLDEPIDVIAHDGGFGGHGRHQFQFLEF